MAIKRLRSYDFGQVLCTINGIVLGGYAEDGGIEFEMDADLYESIAGAGGEVTASKSQNKIVTANITVMQGSAGATFLGSLLQAQQLALGPVPTVVFFLRNFVTGEVVKDAQAYFSARPAPNQNASASERVFSLTLPYAADSIVYGTTVV